MKTSRVLELLNTFKPNTAESTLIDCGLPLKFIGDGAYRTAFHIVGTDLVIKFPRGTDMASTNFNILHALQEYAAIQRITTSKAKKYQGLKKHMPRVYYCDAQGVMVVRRYKMLPLRHWRWRSALSAKVCRTLKLFDGDLENSGNIGIDGRGTLKILDAGYLGAQC